MKRATIIRTLADFAAAKRDLGPVLASGVAFKVTVKSSERETVDRLIEAFSTMRSGEDLERAAALVEQEVADGRSTFDIVIRGNDDPEVRDPSPPRQPSFAAAGPVRVWNVQLTGARAAEVERLLESQRLFRISSRYHTFLRCEVADLEWFEARPDAFVAAVRELLGDAFEWAEPFYPTMQL